DYLLNKIGKDRLVPVEMGAKYTDDSWTQRLISFEEFVNNWILPSKPTKNHNDNNNDDNNDNNNHDKIKDRKEEETDKEQTEIAYLAQHNLFDQIPSLENDILIPDYCFVNTANISSSNPPSLVEKSYDDDDDDDG